MTGARVRIAVGVIAGGVGCAPAGLHAPPSPLPPRDAPRGSLGWAPADPEERLEAWIFERDGARSLIDPRGSALEWALVQVTREVLQEDLHPPPVPILSGWWSAADLQRPEVARWIEVFADGRDPGLRLWLNEAAPYVPHVRTILHEEGLPPQLWVLTLLESGFRHDAKSTSAAVGPWQFLAPTARHCGLLLTDDRDERRDWEYSTRGACRYLRELREDVGDGLLAMAAFNCGPGRVRQAARRSGRTDFWSLELPSETRDYVPRALALIALLGSGAVTASAALPVAYEELALPYPVRIKDLARLVGATPEELHDLNPSWLLPVTPGDGHPVLARVPRGSATQVTAAFLNGTLAQVDLSPERMHRVAPGDTLWAISRRYGVRLSELQEVNGLDDGGVIRAGQTLRIPGGT